MSMRGWMDLWGESARGRNEVFGREETSLAVFWHSVRTRRGGSSKSKQQQQRSTKLVSKIHFSEVFQSFDAT